MTDAEVAAQAGSTELIGAQKCVCLARRHDSHNLTRSHGVKLLTNNLRDILTTQRDNYTPLKVIREQLEAMASGQVLAIVTALPADTIAIT